MQYSEQQLMEIEKLASIYMKITDIATYLNLPAEILRGDIADTNTEVSHRYRRGKMISKMKLQNQEMLLAQVGSPLALVNTKANLIEMEDDE